jgi:hypothetical protein
VPPRLSPLLLLVALGCASGPPAELVAARTTLQDALTTRDPTQVSTAARAASTFEGQDPTLDRLLGDALANVLMRPADGIALLRNNPSPSDTTWATAYESAALRTGEAAVLEASFRETGSTPIAAPEALVAWMGARALRDPHLTIHDFRAAAADCALYDQQPTRGRRTVDQPAPEGFLTTLAQLGATRVVLGRAEVPPDPPADTGQGLQPCTRGRIYPTVAWPKPLPRHVTVAIDTATQPLFLSVQPQDGTPWVFASTRNDIAGELVALARAVSEGAPADPTWLSERLAVPLENSPPPLAD